MRMPGLLLSLGLAVMMFGAPAHAGTLAPSDDPRCDYEFTGAIESGDLEKFEPLGGGPSEWPTICLDSPGGKLTEALEIFQRIWEANIATAVLPGKKCLSACAIIFLGGSFSTGTDVTYHLDRTLWAGGELGFHSPSLGLPSGTSFTGRQVNTAFGEALVAARLIYEINQLVDRGNQALSDHLYYRILSTPPSGMSKVETLADAILSGIGLAWEGREAKTLEARKLTGEEVDFVCQNYLATQDLAESFKKPSTDTRELYAKLTNNFMGPMNQKVSFFEKGNQAFFVAGPYFAATKYFDYYCVVQYEEEDSFVPVDSDETERVGSFVVGLIESETEPTRDKLPDNVWELETARSVPLYTRFNPQSRIVDLQGASGR